jgi:hypothetical protein
MNIYIYKSYGERVEPKDNDVYKAAFLPGCQDDVAICKAESKEEAIDKFSRYFVDASIETVFTLDELWWIESDNVSLLTTY